MENFLWYGFFMMKIFCSTTQNPLVLGFSLMGMSFLIFCIVSSCFWLWYGLIFFLIYVGAVLVLVFYVVCVNSKPKKMVFSFYYLLGLVFSGVVFFFFFSFSHMNFKMTKTNKTFSFFLLKEKIIEVFLFLLLLGLLWFMGKFTFLSVGSIRGFA